MNNLHENLLGKSPHEIAAIIAERLNNMNDVLGDQINEWCKTRRCWGALECVLYFEQIADQQFESYEEICETWASHCSRALFADEDPLEAPNIVEIAQGLINLTRRGVLVIAAENDVALSVEPKFASGTALHVFAPVALAEKIRNNLRDDEDCVIVFMCTWEQEFNLRSHESEMSAQGYTMAVKERQNRPIARHYVPEHGIDYAQHVGLNYPIEIFRGCPNIIPTEYAALWIVNPMQEGRPKILSMIQRIRALVEM